MKFCGKSVKYWVTIVLMFSLAGCATLTADPVSELEATEGAFSVPYRISTSGRFLIDVSVNKAPARPFSVDTGATMSVIYSDYVESADMVVTNKTRFVRGLVGQGDRPVIEGVAFDIGPQSLPMDQLVMLETPPIHDKAVGLLGGDIFAGQIVLFNREEMTATFAPRQALRKAIFAGWQKIPLERRIDPDTHGGLYFSKARFGRRTVPVLIDTGSNLNFINWKLAMMDEDIRRLERKMIRSGQLQGALETTAATLQTVFYDLRLGSQRWDEIPVVITGLEGLASIAPVDKPMMVAGANLFTPHTLAFDLDGEAVYVYPDVKTARTGEP